MATLVEQSCVVCSTPFSDYASNHRKVCSRKCGYEIQRVSHKHYCGWCEKKFYSKKSSSEYCSFSCAGKNARKHRKLNKGIPRLSIRKENHWNWQGGKPRDLRLTTEYKDWRNAVLKRDDYTCQKCDAHGVKLIADHIKPFAYFPKLRLDVNNGRTLCYDCNYEVTYVTKEWRQYNGNPA